MLQRLTPVSLLLCLIALATGCKDSPSSGSDNTPDPTVAAFAGNCGMIMSELSIDTLTRANPKFFGKGSWSGIFRAPNGKLVAVDGKFDHDC